MDFMNNPALIWLDHFVDRLLKHKKQALITLGVACLALGLTFGYFVHKKSVNEAAYKDFIEALKYYDGIVGNAKDKADPSVRYFATAQDKWTQVENVFGQGYQKHKSSTLGSMFLAFKAEAVLNLGKVSEAESLLQEAIAKMPNNDIKEYYKVKVALIKIDKNEPAGLTDLQNIANDDKNVANELALYHLGMHFWIQKKFNDARAHWQRMLVKTGGSKLGQSSPFAQEVKEKLSLLSTENL